MTKWTQIEKHIFLFYEYIIYISFISTQVGTGERCEKNRTYNYPNVYLYLKNYAQSRIIDHRIGLTLYGMDKMMNGEHLDEFAAALKSWRIQKEIEELAANE